MLAKDAVLLELHFPLLATPKLDGIRCLVIEGKAVTRSFKPVPNDHIRNTIESAYAAGRYRAEWDGEIMVRNRSFNDLSGDVRRKDGKPDFYYAVFDLISPTTDQNVVDGTLTETGEGGLTQPYMKRVAMLKHLSMPDFVEKVTPVLIKDMAELIAYEIKCIDEGYEGVMVRKPDGPYKCGRSSVNEGYLLKVKQFVDEEATVIAAEEMMHNDNVAEEDAFGRTKRSKHAENMRPAGVLGKLVCRRDDGTEFEIGTGFTQQDRVIYWQKRGNLIGKRVKFKHQPSGAKDGGKPRFPVFLGWRDDWDLS
jgi:DNA ligase-1